MGILIEDNEEVANPLEALTELVYLAEADANDPALIQKYMALASLSLKDLRTLLSKGIEWQREAQPEAWALEKVSQGEDPASSGISKFN